MEPSVEPPQVYECSEESSDVSLFLGLLPNHGLSLNRIFSNSYLCHRYAAHFVGIVFVVVFS